MSNHDDTDYEIGYGKPPKDTRFQPGTSGNPKGRPKGQDNFWDILDKVLSEKLPISTKNGRKKHVTRLELMLTQHGNNSVKGDFAAFKAIVELAISSQRRKDAKESLAESRAQNRSHLDSLSDTQLIREYNRVHRNDHDYDR